MATATLAPPATHILTWEEYLAEETICKRYDIIDGVREYMSSPTPWHQIILGNIYDALREYKKRSGLGIALMAPSDILIRRTPRLRTRQPDVYFMRPTTAALSQGYPDLGAVTVAPELVVEIISNSETARILKGKLTDYCEIGVSEAWVVRPDAQTVEVMQLTPDGPVSVATYSAGQNVQSLTFPDLTPAVADFFLP